MVESEINKNDTKSVEADNSTLGNESLSFGDPDVDGARNVESEIESTTKEVVKVLEELPKELQDRSDADTRLLSQVRQFLDEEGIDFTAKNPDEMTQVFSMHLSGKKGSYKTLIEVKSIINRVSVFVESPVKVPERKCSIAAEFLTRVNYTLAIGTFEFDYRDGEVRCRNSIEMKDGHLTFEMVRSLVMVPAATMDRFFGGILQVVYGDDPIIETVEACRNP